MENEETHWRCRSAYIDMGFFNEHCGVDGPEMLECVTFVFSRKRCGNRYGSASRRSFRCAGIQKHPWSAGCQLRHHQLMPFDKISASSKRASNIEPQSISIVAISDTHSAHSKLKFDPEYTPDILIHSGDLTNIGSKKELEAVIGWLASLPFKHKIVVAGNHDIGLDKSCGFITQRRRYGQYPTPKETDDLVKLFGKNKIIYLTPERPSAEIEVNDVKLKVYGLPVSPEFPGPDAFMRDRDEDTWAGCQGKYDILVSHSPPRGLLDVAYGKRHVGCDHFLAALKRVTPLVGVFGHIHEARGTQTATWDDGSSTLLCNAANYNHRDGSVAPPTYFTINIRKSPSSSL